jgi:hypothetical protein
LNARDQLAEYTRLMGAEKARKQLVLDNRTPDGVCLTCGAKLGQRHEVACTFARSRVVVERVH